MPDLLRGHHGVEWKWGFLSGLMVVASPCWCSSMIKEAVLQGDKCHLPMVHTGGFHVGLLWRSKRLERRVVVMPHWADCSLSVCGQSRARDILLILQHSRSKNGANLTGTSTVSHHSFLQRLKRSLCSIWFHATGDSFTLCQTNVFFFLLRFLSIRGHLTTMAALFPWAGSFPGTLRGKRQRQNKEDVLESRVSYQPPTSGQDWWALRTALQTLGSGCIMVV